VSMLVSSRDAVPSASVYDATGRWLRAVSLQHSSGTEYRFDWDGLDARGAHVAAGVYFIEVAAGSQAATRKIVVVEP